MNKEIYLDCAASAPVTSSVLAFLTAQYGKKMGNSSSVHRAGVLANVELEKSRIKIAGKINCRPEEIYFTSGATESNNLAIKGLIHTGKKLGKNQIFLSAIEHSSVSQLSRYLMDLGFEIQTIPVDQQGRLDISTLEKSLSERTLLVSVIHANNEMGVIQDLEKIGGLCKKNDTYFHSDGAQAFCKTPVDVEKMQLDLYSMSGHKVHAPKGVGALFVRAGIALQPQIIGGHHEGGLRAGTVAVELASAMGMAAQLYDGTTLLQLENVYQALLAELKRTFSSLRIHGGHSSRLPNILNFAIPGHQGKLILAGLDKLGIRVSIGSACNSGAKKPSQTLMSIGLSEEQSNEAIRVSWGIETKPEDIAALVKGLKSIVGLG